MKLSLLGSKSGLVAVFQQVRSRLFRLRESQSEVAHHGAASCKGAALATPFPCDVVSYGRRYVVGNSGELNELLGWLERRQLALANRYRVGGSWPRGKRVVPRTIATTWGCLDCQRSHRGWTLHCTVSQRPRAICEAVKSFAELMAYKEPVDNSMPSDVAAPPPREDEDDEEGIGSIRGGAANRSAAVVEGVAGVVQAAASAPRADYHDKYFELIYAVGNIHQGETRHETALRYIRQAETPSGEAVSRASSTPEP